MKKSGEGGHIGEILQRGYRYAFSLSHDESKARDLLQDACLVILKGGKPLHIGYLFTTIRHRFIDQYRRDLKVGMQSLDETDEAFGQEESQARFDEELPADYDTLHAALATLRSVEREALFLSAVEGYTAEEIAEMTGQSRGTVSSLIFRARRKLAGFFPGRKAKEAP